MITINAVVDTPNNISKNSKDLTRIFQFGQATKADLTRKTFSEV